MITNTKNKGLSTQNKVLLGLVVLGAGLTQAPKKVRQKVVYGIVGYGFYVGYKLVVEPNIKRMLKKDKPSPYQLAA